MHRDGRASHSPAFTRTAFADIARRPSVIRVGAAICASVGWLAACSPRPPPPPPASSPPSPSAGQDATQLRAQHDAVERAAAAAERARQVAVGANDAAGEMRKFRYAESRQFEKRLAARLSPYRAWFEQAAARIGVDWRLLAAISYQESRWDPLAESPNGAMGLMMLTERTAATLGVKDRANPRQSIFAGARYFEQMYRKIPKRIPEPDRTWLAVAAYNVGIGHLEDARVLTQERGKNPDLWDDVREFLPLLADEKWHAQAKLGYARGSEPVQFVSRVQRFLTLLEWQTASEPMVLDETVTVGAAP